jgi:hypothetical protein
VILYRDNQNRMDPPSWLVGAPDLVVRESITGRHWAIGDAYLCGPQERNKWVDVGDGFSATVVGELDCLKLSRAQRWCETATVPDMHLRQWSIPKPLSYEGGRTFRVAYGADFLPALTEEQTKTEAIARAARDALIAATLNGDPIQMKLACAWTAELLTITNYVTPRVLAELGLIDDVLVAAVLYGAAGLSPDV